MIPFGHEHILKPVSRRDRPDGTYDVHSICMVQFLVAERGEIGHCGLEEHRRFTVEHEPREIRYRFNGIWLPALDLLRLTDGLDIVECDECHGEAGYATCARCAGMGVTVNGEPIRPPELRVVA